MAKGPRRGGGRMVSKQVGGQKGRKAPEVPVNTAESNEVVDKQSMLIHYAIFSGAILASVGLLGWGGYEIYLGLQSKPIGWTEEFWGVSALASIFFVFRGMFWLSIISPVMMSAKSKAWKSQEALCRKALQYGKIIPGGGLTIVFMLIQSLISRGQYEEAIALGEEQANAYKDDPKMAEGLGPVCGAVGMAYQIRGDARQSITWCEKAIDAYAKALEKYTAPKKSIMTKLTESQGGDIKGSILSQMTVSYFNNASSYFNLQNFRLAKVNFQKSMDTAIASPEFPEKADIIKACREQISRMKHT